MKFMLFVWTTVLFCCSSSASILSPCWMYKHVCDDTPGPGWTGNKNGCMHEVSAICVQCYELINLDDAQPLSLKLLNWEWLKWDELLLVVSFTSCPRGRWFREDVCLHLLSVWSMILSRNDCYEAHQRSFCEKLLNISVNYMRQDFIFLGIHSTNCPINRLIIRMRSSRNHRRNPG